jgi:rRNA maturation endonuclease Nob1
MATTGNSPTGRTEECEVCGHETRHEISIQIKTENTTSENAQFSREPYRVAECQVCGHRRSRRMNNA